MILENDFFTIRPVQESDLNDLYCVYSDRKALPFFNSDNCDGDNFYYSTKEKMKSVISFWKEADEKGWFKRLSIVDNLFEEAIGTVELCLRVSEDSFNNYGILRIDVDSEYEWEQVLTQIMKLILPEFKKLYNCKGVITKVPVYAIERTKAAQNAGFKKSSGLLIGKTGFAYDGYWVSE